MYDVCNLMDVCFDESNTEYAELLDRYDGVAATSENMAAMKSELREMLVAYNEAADDFGGEYKTLDLSDVQQEIGEEMDHIVDDAVCTTDSGVEYLQTRD